MSEQTNSTIEQEVEANIQPDIDENVHTEPVSKLLTDSEVEDGNSSEAGYVKDHSIGAEESRTPTSSIKTIKERQKVAEHNKKAKTRMIKAAKKKNRRK